VAKESIEKKYWETCAFKYAHLNDGKGRLLRDGTPLEKAYKENFMDFIDFEGKVMIDYGIGCGVLGRYLFENRGLKKYIGIDIAVRTLQIARHVLRKHPVILVLSPMDMRKYKADILTCLACIQHFPDENHLNGFLENVNKSKVKYAILQIRSATKMIFNNAYEENGNIGEACLTNKRYVSEKLTNYKLVKNSKVFPNKYQYLIYKRTDLD